jgi:hypothetical protein
VGDALAGIFHDVVPGRRFSAMIADDSIPLGPGCVDHTVAEVVVVVATPVATVVDVSEANVVLPDVTKNASATNAITAKNRRVLVPRLVLTLPPRSPVVRWINEIT